jgi:hypothetical protein
VSALTLAQLLAADPAAFDIAARAWEGLADGLDQATEDFIGATRDLGDAWPEGPASAAAHISTADLRAELNAAYNPARRIFEALRHHAGAVTELRDHAQNLISHAERTGYHVDAATGTVTPPAATSAAEADGLARSAQSIADDLGSLLARAGALDDSTTNAINVNLPQPGTGFGRLSLPPVSEQDLLAQRDRPAAAVNAWWQNLTPEQRAEAVRDYPALVGWLDGVPADDRDQANRIRLGGERDDLRQRQQDLQARIDAIRADVGNTRGEQQAAGYEIMRLQGELTTVESNLARLDKVQSSLDKLGPKGYLLGIDAAGDGKAIIAVGNPDTARHTAVWVPGLGTTLDSTRGNVDRVLHLQQAADRLTTGRADDVSTVMWLGYDAPEADTSVVLSDRSKQGAGVLTPFVDGLRATHDGGAYHVTAVGHSYGSTVVGEAALGGGLRVDDIVTAGSPGMHTDHARNLNIAPEHVWAGSASDDPVSNPGGHAHWVQAGANVLFGPLGGQVAGPALVDAEDDGHGPSPHYQDFGANRYVTDTPGHSRYWDENSQSLRNQASVVVGFYGDVALQHGHQPSDLSQ